MSCSKSYFYAKLRLSDMPSTTRGLPSSSNTVHVCIEHSEKRSGGEARPREPCQIRAFKSKKERTAPGYTCASNTRRSTASLQNRKGCIYNVAREDTKYMPEYWRSTEDQATRSSTGGSEEEVQKKVRAQKLEAQTGIILFFQR